MSGTIIKLKYSTTANQPVTDALALAEPAYSYASNKLFIGKNVNGFIEPVAIGGEYFTNILDHTAGVLTASSAIITDSNKWVDEVITGGLTLTTSGGTGQKVTSISTDISSSAADTQLLTALAAKSYVDDSIAALTLAELNDVSIGVLSSAQMLVYDATTQEWKNRTLSGDVVITAAGVTDITASGVTAGTYGSATKIPTFVVGADGRLISAGTENITTSLNVQGDDQTTTVIDHLIDTLKIYGGTGIATATSTDTITINLENTDVTAGTYGSSTAIPTFTVDAQGRLTSAGEQIISTSLDITGDTGTDSVDLATDILSFVGGTGLSSDVTDNTVTFSLDKTTVVAGSYGSASQIPTFTVDTEGRLTAAGTTAITTSVTVAGDSGTGSVASSSTLTFSGGTGITTAYTTNNVSIDLDDTGVTAGVYGSATTIPKFTVDAQGRLTAAEGISINANSFGTVAVSDTDSGYSWSETGSAISTANAATLKIISGEGINVDVDPAADAIRISGGGVNTLATGDHLSVDAPSGDVTIITDATSNNVVGTIVSRDENGDFSAGTINATGANFGDLTFSGNTIGTTSGSNANIKLLPDGSGIVEIAGTMNVGAGIVVTGDLSVQGTTTTVSTEQYSVADSIIYIADGNTADNIDIGFMGAYNDGVQASTGLIRNHNDNEWYLFHSYTEDPLNNTINTNNVTIATLHANIVGNVDGTVASANKLATPRNITLSGDVAGTVAFDGSANVTIATTIQPNSIALGADTTGNYVSTISSSNGGLTITGSGVETAAITIELDTEDDTFKSGAQDAVGELIANGTFVNMTMTYNAATPAINASVPTATNSVKGVAAFSVNNFAVTAGVVTVTVIDGGTF